MWAYILCPLTHTHMHTHMYSHTHTHTHVPSYTYTHAHTHVLTHTHTHTHTHTLSLPNPPPHNNTIHTHTIKRDVDSYRMNSCPVVLSLCTEASSISGDVSFSFFGLVIVDRNSFYTVESGCKQARLGNNCCVNPRRQEVFHPII